MIFDPLSVNARTTRTQQSPIDNTRTGITNLSSDTTAATAGAIGDYATISGGDQNTAVGDNAACPGGLGNFLGGDNTSCSGDGHRCNADGGTTFGHLNGIGYPARNCTFAAAGTVITITGLNVVAEFGTHARFVVGGKRFDKTITVPAAFAAGNTTFTINSAIDGSSTAGRVWDNFQGLYGTVFGQNGFAVGRSSGNLGEGGQISQGIASWCVGNACDTVGNGAVSCNQSRTYFLQSFACNNSDSYGQTAFSSGSTCVSSSTSTMSGGDASIAGFNVDSYTIAGTLVTIVGDATGRFANGDAVVCLVTDSSLYGRTPAAAALTSAPVFAAGNTTFNIAPAPVTSGNIYDLDIAKAAVALGQTVQASAKGAAALNTSTLAALPSSLSTGLQSKTTIEGASAHASGQFSVKGDAQDQWFTLRGATPDGVAGASVVLQVGSSGLQDIPLENGKSYAIWYYVSGTKMGTGAAAKQSWAFFQWVNVDCRTNGVINIGTDTIISGPLTHGAAGVGATLGTASIAPNSFRVTFSLAGGVTAQTQVNCTVHMVEVGGS